MMATAAKSCDKLMTLDDDKMSIHKKQTNKQEQRRANNKLASAQISIIFALLFCLRSHAFIITQPAATTTAAAAGAATSQQQANSFREVAAGASSLSTTSQHHHFAEFAAASTKSLFTSSASLTPHAHSNLNTSPSPAGNAHAPASSPAPNEPESWAPLELQAAKNAHKQDNNNYMKQVQFKAPTPTDLCQIKNGESVAIVEIEESRGSDFGQQTNPLELPIIGSLQEIELKIESETHKYFQLSGKKLELTRPLNRDPVLKENSSSFQIQQAAISSVYLQLSCIDKTTSRPTGSNDTSSIMQRFAPQTKVIVPVLVKVIDINDNAPRFSAPKYTVQVNELAPVGTTILGADQLRALDLDSANNGLIEYSLLDPTPAPMNHDQHSTNNPPSTTATPSTTTTTTLPPISTTQSPKMRSQDQSQKPTFDIHNEPILNGPMDDSDEESDESLLASLANSTSLSSSLGEYPTAANNNNKMLMMVAQDLPDSSSQDSSQQPDPYLSKEDSNGGEQTNGGDSSRAKRAKKRKRRHHAPLSTSALFKTRFRRRSGVPGPSYQDKPIGSSLAPPPWTNLMDPSQQQNQQHSNLASNANDFGSTPVNSNDFFSLETTSLGPVIKLKKPLDFESQPFHQLTIVATDKATNKSERLSSTSQILVRVSDGDDQAPAFLIDSCATTISQSTLAPSSANNMIQNSDRLQAAASYNIGHRVAPNNGFKILTDQSEDFDFGDTADSGRHLMLGDSHPPFATIVPHPSSNSSSSNRLQAPVTNFQQQQQRLRQMSPEYLTSSSSCVNGAIEYWATVMAGDSDQLVRIQPQPIKARDRDSLNAPIHYNFVNGTPANYSHYFSINPVDGVVKQVAPVDRLTGLPERFIIWLEAQEQTPKRLASQARLTIDVKAADWSPPTLEANFYSGFVEENAPVGTLIKSSPAVALDSSTNITSRLPLRVQLGGQMQNGRKTSAPTRGLYEFETTSDLFKVDKDGFVYVAAANLDADSAEVVFKFQVTAKLVGHSAPPSDLMSPISVVPLASSSSPTSAAINPRLITSPISLSVSLVDLDDNGPQLRLPNQQALNQSSGLNQQPIASTEPVQLQASSQASGSRHVTTLQADDSDLNVENRQHRFSLVHVSSGGRDRFKLDESTGELRAIGKFAVGEQFSLTLLATDSHARSSQAILEIVVVPGPNLSAPQFIASPSSQAMHQNKQQMIGQQHAKQQAAYHVDQLSARSSSPMATIHAHQQSSGASSSLAGAQVALGDFSVEITEALAPHSPVFQLHAQDPESDQITYHLIGGNVNQDFYINQNTGMVYVQNKLDREEVSQYHLLVQARDSGGLSTVRGLKIKILDTNDENPVFQQEQYEFSVSEDQPVGTVIGRVRALDSDAGDFGRVSYSLLEQQQQQQHHSSSPIFVINENTGELRLAEKLDYELSSKHSLIVRAQDQDARPRSASCRVSISVLDVQDELPYFAPGEQHLRAQIWENQPANEYLPNFQVKAIDPDSTSQISYELKWASVEQMFAVDATSGRIQLLQAVDYESRTNYTLIVGTSENTQVQINNDSSLDEYLRESLFESRKVDRSAACRIDLQLLDLNDNEPKFDVASLAPIRVKNSAHLGAQIGSVSAQDKDGSKPNNQVRYELVNQNKNLNQRPEHALSCADFFMLDSASGQLFVKSDLRKLTESECQLELLVSDLGQVPGPLSSRASLTIYVDHMAEQPALGSLPAFADNSFWTELSENSLPGSLVKILPIINKHQPGHNINNNNNNNKNNLHYECEMLNEDNQEQARLFQVHVNKQGDCEIRLQPVSHQPQLMLDYETKQRYSLTVRLNSLASSLGGAVIMSSSNATTLAQVVINVLDRNDNKPQIAPPSRYADLTHGRYLAVVAADAPTDTQVMQIKATDLDSLRSGNGLISYEFANHSSNNADSSSSLEADLFQAHFSIEPTEGTIRTNQPLDHLEQAERPVKLVVLAHDNPLDERLDRVHETRCEVVVNVISARHRMALAFPGIATSKLSGELKNDLLSILQERSGLISGLERVESMKVRRKSSQSTASTSSPVSMHLGAGGLRIIESDVNGTDFWFYLIEPGTFKLLTNDDPRVLTTLLDDRAQSSLKDIVHQRLNIREVRIRLPYQTITYDPSPAHLSSSSISSLLDSGLTWLIGSFKSKPAQPAAGQTQEGANLSNKTATSQIDYATRVLLSTLGSQYTRIAGDQYAAFLISAAILITLSSFFMLICQCKSSGSSKSKTATKQREHHSKQYKKTSKKQRQSTLSSQSNTYEPIVKDFHQQQAAHLQMQLQQQQQHSAANHLLSPQSYFLPSLDEQKQQQQQTPTTVTTLNSSGNLYESFASPGGAQLYGSSFSTANGLNRDQSSSEYQVQSHARMMYPSSNNNNNNETVSSADKQATLARKEYETQMLKMSVIYDDNQSVVDDRNSNANRIIMGHH